MVSLRASTLLLLCCLVVALPGGCSGQHHNKNTHFVSERQWPTKADRPVAHQWATHQCGKKWTAHEPCDIAVMMNKWYVDHGYKVQGWDDEDDVAMVAGVQEKHLNWLAAGNQNHDNRPMRPSEHLKIRTYRKYNTGHRAPSFIVPSAYVSDRGPKQADRVLYGSGRKLLRGA